MKHRCFILRRFLLLQLLVSVGFSVFSAKKGDYRFTAVSGAWSDPASWQIYRTSWTAASNPPGELNNVFFEKNAAIYIENAIFCKSLTTKKAGVSIYFNTPEAALSVITDALIDGGKLQLIGMEGASSKHNSFIVKGILQLEGGSALLVDHTNIVVNNNCILNDGTFEGASSPTKNNNASHHFFGRDILIKKGRFVCTAAMSDPIYLINGDVVVGPNGRFVGMSGSSGAPVINLQGGMLTQKGGWCAPSEGLELKRNSYLTINFSNDSSWNHKSFLSVGVPPIENVNFWRFSVNSGRSVELQSDINLVGKSSSQGFSSFTIHGGAILNTNKFCILGRDKDADSRFVLETDALLEIGHPQGISKVPDTSGAIQTGSRKFLETALYAYTGTGNQITGDGLPFNIKGLTIKNFGAAGADTVYLSNTNLSIGGNVCTIIKGIFDVGSNAFTGHNCIFNMKGGALKISKTSSTVLLPELQGLYNLEGGTIHLSGNGFQVIRGNISYYNLSLSGTNLQGVNYKFPSSHIVINNRLEISDHAILDAVDKSGNSVSITGEGGLLMDGMALFRLKKLNATLPELKATAQGTNYNLIGGTVELYGSEAGQTHSLNGTKGARGADIEYYNVILNAQALNRKEGNVVLQSSVVVKNNFEVQAPASFQISNAFSLKGPGNFNLNSGATLFYGSPQGICSNLNKGNLRLSGKITLSKAAGFGFVGSLPMETGDLLPDTCRFLHIIKKAAGQVALTQSIMVSSGVYFSNGILVTTDNTVLGLNNEAFAEGASNESHVNGPVVKCGNTSFQFPVGNNKFYRPLQISAPGSSGSVYAARYISSNPILPFGGKMVKGLDHISQCEYWTLQQIHPFAKTDSLSVTLTWGENSCGVDNTADLRVTHFHTDAWQNDGNVDHTPVPADAGKIQSKVIAFEKAKWPFTLASVSSANALPVSLVSFDGSLVSGNVLLKWTTASETNTDCFIVEHSLDGLYFEGLGKVAGLGNSIIRHDYSYLDHNPVPGTYYYRLRQIDRDGNFSFTDLVKVVVSSNEFLLEVTAGEGVVVRFQIEDEGTSLHYVKIFDTIGREVYAVASNEKRVHLTIPKELPCGLYFVQVKCGNVLSVQKFIF